MSLNKYGCNIIHACPTALTVHSAVDPILLYTQVKTKETATFIYNSIIMYVPTRNMSLIRHIYADYYLHKYETTVSVYINTLYEFNATYNVTRSTGIHLFHITDIFPMKKQACYTTH